MNAAGRPGGTWLLVAAVVAVPLLVVLSVVALAGYVTSALLADGLANHTASVRCGPSDWLLAPRCFGGVTVEDLEAPLAGLGYTCATAFGVEHSGIDCQPPHPNGSPPSPVVAQISVAGSSATSVWASACVPLPDSRVRPLFEAVAGAPFAHDGARAHRARSWIDASLDGRLHQTTIADYSYAVSSSGGCEHLVVTA